MSNQLEGTGDSSFMSQYTVVMVDDEQNILQSLKRCFRREPFQIACAGSGVEGLKLIAETPHVAVIISDQKMPEMTGAELLTRSRALAPDAIRVLLTGFSDNESTVAAMNEGGATHYIVKQKPWDDAELLQTVRGCVRDYHLTIENRRQQEIIYQQNEELRSVLSQLTEQNIQLNDARKYAENIVETVREPLLVLDSCLKVITANRSFYEIFKVTREETIGNFIYELGNRQWDIPKLRILFEDILPHETMFDGYEVEHDFPALGRKVFLLNARQIFQKDVGSQIILVAMEDITERRLAEKMREDIERITRHDLKTPLNPIISIPEILLMDANLTPEQVDWIQLIKTSGHRMLNIIDSSLSLYKMEQGTYIVTPVPFNLFPLIADIGKELATEITKKRLRLVTQLNDPSSNTSDGFMLNGEAMLCYTMLANLIKNAIEASPPDETITVSCDQDAVWNYVGIHNKGAVPEKIKAGFFDKYVTHGKKTGTGLGTYSAQSAARTQHGDISMQSSEEAGTLITISLPKIFAGENTHKHSDP